MTRFIGLLAATLVGAAGWWIGNMVGLFSAVVLSAVGSGVGFYYGRNIASRYLP